MKLKSLIVFCRVSAIAVFISLLWISCDRDPSYKDKFDGKWQLLEVVDANGISEKVDTVWYNFQNTLFMYQFCRVYPDSIVYEHSYGYKFMEGNNVLLLELTNEDFLPFTDWTEQQRYFVVEKYSRSNLILTSEEKRYHFRKF